MSVRLAAASFLAASTHGARRAKNLVCDNILEGTPIEDYDPWVGGPSHYMALQSLDLESVKSDMSSLLKDSKDCWPADWGDYGPFMIRLAWHSSGSYRKSDGRGGSGGARMRFSPERDWDDNANLDKARALLYPLKEKYGDGLSWADLFILAGTQALRDAGAPIRRMCFGRADDSDGERSEVLNEPCIEQGRCDTPWGSTTVGLIYVNPEGPMGNPDPRGSVEDIRRTFTTMGHTDIGTVALIGGGHALGKAHGACESGPGLPPSSAFKMGKPIYQGTCNSHAGSAPGIGNNTVTSGFEGAWTSNPLEWDNEFFKDLVNKKWEKFRGPGGHWQWRIVGGDDQKRMRLTSDMALLEDDSYREIVEKFANDMDSFNDAFNDAWDQLVSNGAQFTYDSRCDDGSLTDSDKARFGIQMRDDDDDVLEQE